MALQNKILPSFAFEIYRTTVDCLFLNWHILFCPEFLCNVILRWEGANFQKTKVTDGIQASHNARQNLLQTRVFFNPAEWL